MLSYFLIKTVLLFVGTMVFVAGLFAYDSRAYCVNEVNRYEEEFCERIDRLKLKAVNNGYFDKNAKKIVSSTRFIEDDLEAILSQCNNEREKHRVLRAFERMLEYKESAILDMNAIFHDRDMNFRKKQF